MSLASKRSAGNSKSSSMELILEELDAAAPTPAEAMVLNEALERRLEALHDPELRQISLWRLEGYTNREIADRLRLHRAIDRAKAEPHPKPLGVVLRSRKVAGPLRLGGLAPCSPSSRHTRLAISSRLGSFNDRNRNCGLELDQLRSRAFRARCQAGPAPADRRLPRGSRRAEAGSPTRRIVARRARAPPASRRRADRGRVLEPLPRLSHGGRRRLRGRHG